MEAVRVYRDALRHQFDFLTYCASLDGYFIDCPPSQWMGRRFERGRRHWTRRDIARYNRMLNASNELPSRDGKLYVPVVMECLRVPVALRVLSRCRFTLIRKLSDAAIEYCSGFPCFSPVAATIFELTQTHGEWVAWMVDNCPSDVDSRRKDLWIRFEAMFEMMEASEPEQALSADDVTALDAMLILGATIDTPQSQKAIFAECGWTIEGKRKLHPLKNLGLVRPCAKGWYLTKSGIKRAKALRGAHH